MIEPASMSDAPKPVALPANEQFPMIRTEQPRMRGGRWRILLPIIVIAGFIFRMSGLFLTADRDGFLLTEAVVVVIIVAVVMAIILGISLPSRALVLRLKEQPRVRDAVKTLRLKSHATSLPRALGQRGDVRLSAIFALAVTDAGVEVWQTSSGDAPEMTLPWSMIEQIGYGAAPYVMLIRTSEDEGRAIVRFDLQSRLLGLLYATPAVAHSFVEAARSQHEASTPPRGPMI